MNNILISTHKDYSFPKSALYIPIQVGKISSSAHVDAIGDDKGIHIAEKNSTFCELTALYWAWKNDFFKDSDFCGLVHYRRYFKGSSGEKLNGMKILGEDEILNYLKEYDILLPKKRRYYIETVISHYSNAHYQKDILLTRTILEQQASDYLAAFDEVMQSRSLHLFNMFIMSPKYFYAYMDWLFPILFALEERIDTESYDSYQKRVFGYIAERLFNVWLLKNDLRIKCLGVNHLEGENYILKAWCLIMRKNSAQLSK